MIRKNKFQIYSSPLKVYCNFDDYGNGWTVLQRRKDGSENFTRGWKDYVKGFGKVKGKMIENKTEIYCKFIVGSGVLDWSRSYLLTHVETRQKYLVASYYGGYGWKNLYGFVSKVRPPLS